LNPSRPPPTVGRYQIIRPLGSGAMGDVYLAQDPNIDRRIALKTVRLQGGEGKMVEERKQRLLREAKAAGRLLHPHVITLFDAGEAEDLLYLAFELVDGTDLNHRLRSGPRRERHLLDPQAQPVVEYGGSRGAGVPGRGRMVVPSGAEQRRELNPGGDRDPGSRRADQRSTKLRGTRRRACGTRARARRARAREARRAPAAHSQDGLRPCT